MRTVREPIVFALLMAVVAAAALPTGAAEEAGGPENVDGSLDSSFGGDGVVFAGIPGNSLAGVGVAVQVNGRPILAGYDADVGQDFVARFLADGQPDPAFGTNGVAYTGVQNIGRRVSVAIQPDGKIVLAGSDEALEEHFLARFHPDGTLDSAFGTNGIARTGVHGSTRRVGLVVQSDGRLVLSATDFFSEHFLARFEQDGTLDIGFGVGGIARTGVLGLGGSGLLIQPDGKLVLAGQGFSAGDFLARFLPDGTHPTHPEYRIVDRSAPGIPNRRSAGVGGLRRRSRGALSGAV